MNANPPYRRRNPAAAALLAGALLALAGGGVRAGAQTASNAVPALEGLVRQWVELRGQLAAERRAGAEQAAALEREIALLETERADLQQELAAEQDAQQGADRAQVALQARRDLLEKALGDVRPALDRAETDLRRWRTHLPPPLLGAAADAFQRLEPAGAAAARPETERLQQAVALYAHIEDLQNGIHAVKQVLTLDGERREMEVLYLGLTRGFAVSGDNRSAAVGTPAAEGWLWQPRDALAPRVRLALDVHQRQRVAEAAPLPLGLVEAPR